MVSFRQINQCWTLKQSFYSFSSLRGLIFHLDSCSWQRGLCILVHILDISLPGVVSIPLAFLHLLSYLFPVWLNVRWFQSNRVHAYQTVDLRGGSIHISHTQYANFTLELGTLFLHPHTSSYFLPCPESRLLPLADRRLVQTGLFPFSNGAVVGLCC